MLRYTLSRLLQTVLTLIGISIVVFVLSRASGDPLHLMMPLEATDEDYALVRHSLGLDRPLPVQYAIYLGRVLQGDFGTSLRAKAPVRELLAERLPYSLRLAGVAIGFALVVAVPLGVVAAMRRDGWQDRAAQLIALLGQSMPSFWTGLVLMLVFAVHLAWLPTSGADGPLHYVMPAFTLGWFTMAGVTRLVRSSMLEVLDSEFVKFARIKGLRERSVIGIHALRNALIPVVTFVGVYFALFAGMAVVVETVFNWPGMGRLAYDAVIWRDFPVIQGVVLTVAAMVMLINLLVDFLYAWIDPRIRL